LPGGFGHPQAITTKSRVYLLGNGPSKWASASTTVYTALINSDGIIGSWTTGTSLPGALSFSQAILPNQEFIC
jgi:hypothetical protein